MIIDALNKQTIGENVSSIQLNSMAWSDSASHYSHYKTIFLSHESNTDILEIDDETKSFK